MKSTKASSQHPSARRLILASLAAVALPLLATSGRAATPSPGEEPATVTVQFADLNLKSRAGLNQLYERIITAARMVCGGDDGDMRPLENWTRFRLCTRQSTARAVAAVGIPELVALYARKAGHPIARTTLLAKR